MVLSCGFMVRSRLLLVNCDEGSHLWHVFWLCISHTNTTSVVLQLLSPRQKSASFLQLSLHPAPPLCHLSTKTHEPATQTAPPNSQHIPDLQASCLPHVSRFRSSTASTPVAAAQAQTAALQDAIEGRSPFGFLGFQTLPGNAGLESCKRGNPLKTKPINPWSLFKVFRGTTEFFSGFKEENELKLLCEAKAITQTPGFGE